MTLERDLAAGTDPLAWAALADLCEERGATADADLWRRRAACLRAVLDVRHLAAPVPGRPPLRVQVPLCHGWAVHAYATRTGVRALLLHQPPGSAAVLAQRGFYHLPRVSLLGRTQRSPKAAARYLRRKAFEWAEMLTPGGA